MNVVESLQELVDEMLGVARLLFELEVSYEAVQVVIHDFSNDVNLSEVQIFLLVEVDIFNGENVFVLLEASLNPQLSQSSPGSVTGHEDVF